MWNRRILIFGSLGVALLILIGFCTFRLAFGEPYREYRGHRAAVYAVDYLESKHWIAGGGEDGLRVWNVGSLEEICSRPGRVTALAFLDDKRLMCADADQGILLLDTNTWETTDRFGIPAYRIVANVSRDGQWLAASFSIVPDNEEEKPSSYDIRLWRLAGQPFEETTLQGHQGPVAALTFHPTAAQLISRSEDGTVRLWDVETGRQISQRGQPLVFSKRKLAKTRSDCVFSPDGSELLTSQYVSPFPEFERAEPLATNLPGAHASAYSPDGKWIASGHADGTVRLWNAGTRDQAAEFSAFVNQTAVYRLCFSEDSKLLITAGEGIMPGFSALPRKVKPIDTVVRVWRVQNFVRK